MMRTLKYTAVLAAAALALAALFPACTTDPNEEAEPNDPNTLPPSSDLPICLDVEEVFSQSDTRALIGNDRETGDPTGSTDPNNSNYFIPLSDACRTDLATDPLKEKGFAVGLFSDYAYKNGKDTVRVYDLYRGARLVYLYDRVTDDKVLSRWDTNVAARYWRSDTRYIFRAYYPQRLHTYTISNSNATTLAMVYPTRKLQYDLLLGVDTVNTMIKPDAVRQPVTLKLGHALSALRFVFKLEFEDADFLTSVYLLNDEDRHFFTQGTVTYGTRKDIHNLVWLQDYNPPADEVLYKWVPPLKYWYGVDTNNDGVVEELSAEAMLKKWKVGVTSQAEADAAIGDPFDNPVLMISDVGTVSPGTGEGDLSGGGNDNTGGTTPTPTPTPTTPTYHGKTAQAYYGMENHFNNDTKQWVNNPQDDVAVDGAIYCRNSGWLLIPPQESFGKLTLCFTTKKGEQAIYKVTLPQKTGTLIDKNGKVMKDAAGHFIKESTEGKDAWVAGVRYTYVVNLSETNLGVGVSIEPWNERKHSTEITF